MNDVVYKVLSSYIYNERRVKRECKRENSALSSERPGCGMESCRGRGVPQILGLPDLS